jgi:type II secretory ATPase GspE/PulE/Tfp pilus assembly ATPase PilB-like protein
VVLKRPTITDMKAVLSTGLFASLQQFGWQLVAAGETNVEEIERVAGTG